MTASKASLRLVSPHLVPLILVLLLCAPLTGLAQQYPAKPIRIVVPSPAGSAADTVTRTVATKLAERLGQQVISDPRPGASGIVAAEIVLKAAPDGYTLLAASSASHGINVSLYPKLPYDAVRDCVPVSLLVQMPLVLTLHPTVPAKNLKEFIALARARPGQLNFASSGSGTTTHLAGELLKYMARIDYLHVPYKGSQQALVDTLSGQMAMNIAPILTALPQVKSGRLRAIAVTTAQRSTTAPDIPTVAEAALPGYEATLWYGLCAPAGTSTEIVKRLNGEVVSVLALAEVRESLKQLGADAGGSGSEAFGTYIKSEIAKWATVVKLSGAQPN